MTRVEVQGQAVFVWNESESTCVLVSLSGGQGRSQCGGPGDGLASIITEPLDGGSERQLHIWRLADPTERYVSVEVAGEVFVQEARGGLSVFVTPAGTPRFAIVDGGDG